MKRKIMLLMMIIPLVLIVTIMTVGQSVSIVSDIPVSGIKITTQNEDGIISVDLAAYSDIYIKAEVFPINARNRNYSISVSDTGNGNPADISVNSDGKLIIGGTGKAKITVTSNENAYTDSVIVSVTSTKVLDYGLSLTSISGESMALFEASEGCDYDYFCSVNSGDYTLSSKIYPSSLSESLISWQSSAPEIVNVGESTGKINAMLSGEAVLTAACSNAVGGILYKKIKISVGMANTQSGITVNGTENGTLLCHSNTKKSVLYIETATDGTLSLSDVASALESYSIQPLSHSTKQYKVTLVFDENKRTDDILLAFSLNGGRNNVLTITFAEFSFNVYTGYHNDSTNIMYHKKGAAVTYYVDDEPYDADMKYVWACSNNSILELSQNGRQVAITAKEKGTATLTVTAFLNGEQQGEAQIKTVKVVEPVYEIAFSDNASTNGIACERAIGGYKLNGHSYVKDYTNLPLKYRTADGWQSFDGDCDISVLSSDDDIAEVYRTINSIKANVKGEGSVMFSANWIYDDYFNDSVKDNFTFKAVGEGINVNSYNDLSLATEDGKKVVLTSDIMLGKQNATLAELESMIKEMPTTYDWQFYTNQGLDRPNVKYIIEFKNDLYGNGFEINADYIAKAEDAVGTPLVFKGPLDFVAIATASVKAQDNISFLVRTDGVTLNNVVLKGCSDQSLIDADSGYFDLTGLNYVGTVLEICSDAHILNSRISNGRTVVRIFGRSTKNNPVVTSADQVNAATERVRINLESCILTNAREFILKIGSNRAVLAEGTTPSTFNLVKFKNQNSGYYNVYDDAMLTDNYFYNNYVLTDVTAKNCVFATSGLFSVGMETHFGGEMLAGLGSGLKNWENLAATAFPSILRLEGKIELLDWKNLTNVDSSTLIETTNNLSETSQFLKLDISSMLKKVSSDAAYSGITADYEGETYVHGGVALYGGGYNFSLVDFSSMTSEMPSDYKINLSILANGEQEGTALYLQGTMLPLAAGPSDFRFFMYNANSTSDYQSQIKKIKSGEAYKVIPA